MHILFLTQIIPYPPDSGPKVKTWHVLRYLVESGHKVTLASFVREEELPHVAELEKLCHAVHTVPIKRSRLADILYMGRSFLTGESFLMARDNLPGMQALVRRLALEEQVDVVHADQLTMTQFALQARRAVQASGKRRPPALIFDAHNAVWTIVERMTGNANPVLGPVLRLEAGRVKRYEGMLVSEFEYTMAVSEVDRRLLLEALQSFRPEAQAKPERMPVIPIAVDTRTLAPIQRQAGSCNIVTLGTLHYPPNADGIRWFVHESFPLIRQKRPEVTLTIIGKNPPADFLEMQSQDPQHIQVTGYVPELPPYLEKAALMVVPVRAGGGMRVRILEAFARAMPVVTTTVGLEGIEARHDEEVIVQDTPESFAEAVLQVLADPTQQEKLALNGRRLVERKYDWQVVLGDLEKIYTEISNTPS